ncbi:MAG: hypothetical protein DRJ47_05745 [Thermoprotei archaeon]|nr:MAG: hypothetical protein DRJ47_05745 [Thermoprotei archaeon]
MKTNEKGGLVGKLAKFLRIIYAFMAVATLVYAVYLVSQYFYWIKIILGYVAIEETLPYMGGLFTWFIFTFTSFAYAYKEVKTFFREEKHNILTKFIKKTILNIVVAIPYIIYMGLDISEIFSMETLYLVLVYLVTSLHYIFILLFTTYLFKT